MKSFKLFFTLVILAMLGILSIGVISVAAQTGAEPASPQAELGGSFTYQGYLTDDSGAPLNDSCDFRFRLYDAASGGTLIGGSDEISSQQVVDGRFTVTVNSANEFGSQPFAGDERYLEVSVGCTGDSGYTILNPRQLLRAVPYAVFALNVPDHDHAGASWDSSTSGSVLTLDNTGTNGDALTVKGSPLGYAIVAEGAIRSTEDMVLYLSPHSLVERGDSGCLTLTAQDNGSMQTKMNAGCSPYLSAPVSTFGSLFGSTVYVKSLEVCYKDDNDNNRILVTSVIKNDGDEGDAFYIFDTTTRGEETRTCYTLNATTPRLPVDNSTWVQFNMNNMNPMGSGYDFYIYTIKLTLTEVRE